MKIHKSVIVFFCLFFTSIYADAIINGAGATFPSLLYRKWIETYQKDHDIRIVYEPVGSSKGRNLFLDRKIDFGGTDFFLSDTELADVNNDIIHIPTCVGAVAIIYNLPNQPMVRFTPDVLADVFMGKINNWSDKRIQKINSGLRLPDLDITVIHRSEGSGTTFIFSDYLSKVSNNWKNKIGRGKTLRWPVGLGLEGNSEIASFVKKIPGSIGYVQLSYAKKNKLPVAFVRNKSGNYVMPTLESVSQAANVKLPDNNCILLTDTESASGYPISAFTYIILYKDLGNNGKTITKAKSMIDFFHWMILDGQKFTKPLDYSPLPESAVKRADYILHQTRFNNRLLIDYKH